MCGARKLDISSRTQDFLEISICKIFFGTRYLDITVPGGSGKIKVRCQVCALHCCVGVGFQCHQLRPDSRHGGDSGKMETLSASVV